MQVSIAGTTLFNYQGSETAAVLKVYATQNFFGGLVEYVGGPVGNAYFCKSVNCTIAGGQVTIPQVDLESTTDSSSPQARYIALLYTPLGTLITGLLAGEEFAVPPETPTTWSALEAYNAARRVQMQDGFYTAQQVDARLAELTGAAAKASELVIGATKLDVAAANPNDPIAIGSNSPLVTTKANVSTIGRTELDVAPVDANHPIAVGSNSPLVTTKATLDVLGKTELDVAPTSAAKPIAVGSNAVFHCIVRLGCERPKSTNSTSLYLLPYELAAGKVTSKTP